jgi:uroporphyrinogen decarboxylase
VSAVSQPNGLERMCKALNFLKPDRVPVFLNNSFAATRVIGASVGEVTRDAEKLAEALLQSYRKFGYDGVRVGLDVAVEAEAMGCEAYHPEDAPVSIKRHIIAEPKDLDELKKPNPETDGRMPNFIKATEICAREIGSEGFITSLVMGPLNLASQLMGVRELLIMFIDEPEFVERLLDFAAEVTVDYARALYRAGAHCIVMGEAFCSVSMIGPGYYRQFVAKRHRQVVEELKRIGVRYTTYHICGELEPILFDVADTGVDSMDVDTPVDMQKCRQMLGPRMAFIGNVSPSALLNESPEHIEELCREALAGKDDLGLVLGAGCNMAADTPFENTQAMVAAAKKYGGY